MLGRVWIEIGGAMLHRFPDPGRCHLLIVALDLPASFELALDAGRLVDEKHHDVNRRLAKMNSKGSVEVLVAQLIHFADQELQALHLDLGAGESIEDGPVAIGLLQQRSEDEANHLPVTDHPALVFDSLRFGTAEEGADDDGFTREASSSQDELGMGPFSRPRRATEENELFGEMEVFAAEFRFQLLPDAVENQLSILDFQVGIGNGSGEADIHW